MLCLKPALQYTVYEQLRRAILNVLSRKRGVQVKSLSAAQVRPLPAPYGCLMNHGSMLKLDAVVCHVCGRPSSSARCPVPSPRCSSSPAFGSRRSSCRHSRTTPPSRRRSSPKRSVRHPLKIVATGLASLLHAVNCGVLSAVGGKRQHPGYAEEDRGAGGGGSTLPGIHESDHSGVRKLDYGDDALAITETDSQLVFYPFLVRGRASGQSSLEVCCRQHSCS